MLVAEGRLDAFVLFGGEAWDHAACSAIVISAGGCWSDLEGDERVRGGAGVYSNSHIHDALLATLGGWRRQLASFEHARPWGSRDP